MLLSRKWLTDYTKIDAAAEEYENKMTMSGSKVEETVEPGEEIKKVVVGHVTEIHRHEDSDHLWVCTVDVGGDQPVQIVTGAQNVQQGDMVPVALHKSRLPGGVKITKGNIRGVKSEGMLCSLVELRLDTHDYPYAIDDGIFILQEPCSPGDDIRPIIGADDSIVEFEITNNRPDCLSMIGLARESAVTFGTELSIPEPKVKGGGGNIKEHLSVEIETGDLCPRYTARMVRDIKIEPSPTWMRQRLRAAGVRPINNIVDITNYVMLEYGQPMHAFDYKCLDGGEIIVRNAKAGETMNTLDGTARELTPDMLVIADAQKAVGVAGVMGGENSEITDDTRLVVFESANFSGVSIRKTAMTLGLRTDASSRFEKSLDIENTYPAVERACELVELLGAGVVCDGVIDVRMKERIPVTLTLEPERINRLLGTQIDEAFMITTLQKLGFTVENGTVTVPSWRGDIDHYSDLAEEIARFYGYEKIEPTMYGGVSSGERTAKQKSEREVGNICRAMGYSEILTYSFIGPTDYEKIGLQVDEKAVKILNPLGEDTSIMRTTSLPLMLKALAVNWGQRAQSASLYELATVYLPPSEGQTLPNESRVITLGAYGGCDFFAIKSAVEALLREMRTNAVRFEAERTNPAYHPGRTAAVYSGDTRLGTVGQIHPAVAKNYGLGDTFAAELDFLTMLECASAESKFTQLPKFPAITRDIAVVCDNAVTAGDLHDCILSAGGKLLRQAKLFDIYTGDQVQQGKKSVAFALTLRSDEATLTDEDADEVISNILSKLSEQLGAVIR